MRVPVSGASLFARVDGDDAANKPWLLLSNSLATDHTMWDGQMALLTKKFRVLRYDTRGHGHSDAPAGAYSFPMLVADVIALRILRASKSSFAATRAPMLQKPSLKVGTSGWPPSTRAASRQSPAARLSAGWFNPSAMPTLRPPPASAL
jgi:hypothetical protein